jgi:plasmid maintenance system antidote protein VapI
MNQSHATAQFFYDPDRLLDTLIQRLNLRHDADLSRALEVAPPMISKIRHRKFAISASLLIRMHEVSLLSVAELRMLMGDRRAKYRISRLHFKPGRDARSAGTS